MSEYEIFVSERFGIDLDLSKVQECSFRCLCVVFDSETNWGQGWEIGLLMKFIPCVLNLNQFLSDIISQ